ncbi:MAG: AAA family ATPase [Bacteroidota bacterium]
MKFISIIAIIIVYKLVATPVVKKWLQKTREHLRKIFFPMNAASIFYNDTVDSKKLFVKKFATLPCSGYIDQMDTSKVFEYLRSGAQGKVLSIYQHTYFDWKQAQQFFSKSILILKGNIMIEIASDYTEVLFANNNYDKGEAIIEALVPFKAEAKMQPYEINIITLSKQGLELKPLEINSTELAIGLYYNDDFAAVDALIKRRLLMEQDKGIILLHGLPGTGKTTYLRHLIGSLKKKVMFVSPAVAENLMNPEFMDLLIDNPNAVLVIEDAENIILDRRYSSQSSVSNLLNISDGLLSDCLNVQIICTFNSDIAMVDSALMRKGRLIAKYEFGKLAVTKAQQLSNHLGFDTLVNKPMTLAEIANQDEMVFETKQVQVLGFRRDAIVEN